MEFSVSILGIKDNVNNRIDELNKLNIDYLHVDVMDGKFVPNVTDNYEEVCNKLKNNTKKLDIHLMTCDVKEYIERYKELKPDYITFHYEVNENINSIINLLKEHNIKVGIALKPATDPLMILPYIENIDLVLVMTVEPGKGGQKFMEAMTRKISELQEIRKNGHLNFKIEVDGGINDKTINLVEDVDISVVGSYITSNDNYKQKVKIIEGKLHDRKI